MQKIKLVGLWILGVAVLAFALYALSPLFKQKVEAPRNPQIDSLGAVIVEIQAQNKELSKQIVYLDQQITENYATLKNDLAKIKRFTPVTRAKYLDSLFAVHHVK